jgi:hypothetical protein
MSKKVTGTVVEGFAGNHFVIKDNNDVVSNVLASYQGKNVELTFSVKVIE